MPTPPYRVALLGFSAFESGALASCFRLAADRTPAYEQAAALADAHYAVVDADQPAAVQSILDAERSGDAVFIGAHPPTGARSWMSRPIDPLHVLRELDTMAAAAGPEPPTLHALLVDDSRIALRFLQSRLAPFAIETQCATDSRQAIALYDQQPFDLAFLDVELGGGSELDGLALCQHIKRSRRWGDRAPAVALVSVHNGELDRVRGMLAGADACLGKPLDEGRLHRLLQQHGARPLRRAPHAEAD